MERKLSKRALTLKPSPIQELSHLAQRCNAINLAEGFPDFPAPTELKEAAIAAINADFNQYRHVQGLCDYLAWTMKLNQGLDVDPVKNIAICCGQSEAFAAAILSVVDQGDEVLLLDPAYETYEACITMAGGTPVYVALNPPHWTLDIKKLMEAFTSRTKAIVLNRLLDNATERAKAAVKEQKEEWKKYGCTILSDGWTDGKNRTIINVLVACKDEVVFLKSVDASNIVKNAENLANMLELVCMEVGLENVVQIITDNAAAGRILQGKHHTIFWTPCAAHVLDLLLEDIGKLDWVTPIVEDGRRITKYIYNHPWVLHLMREYTQGRELVRSGVTRFATVFLTLQSILGALTALKQMFVSQAWLDSSYSKKLEGDKVSSIVFDPLFAQRAMEIVKVYEHVTFDSEHISLASLPGMLERTIITSSMSKTYSVTGWRVGWAVAPFEIASSIRNIHVKLTDSAPAPFQEAALVALKSSLEYFQKLRMEYKERRDFIVDLLCEVGFKVHFRPQGAVFVFAELPETCAISDVEYVAELIKVAGVAAVPGCGFFHDKGKFEKQDCSQSATGSIQEPELVENSQTLHTAKDYRNRYIRFAYCKNKCTLLAAAEKLHKYNDKLG